MNNIPNIPQDGSTIVFSKIPNGSYANTGEEYRVTVSFDTVYLKCVASGSGTFDKKAVYRFAEWEVMA